MTDAEVIDSMLDRLSGKRAAPTVRDALRRAEQALDLVVNCDALSPTLRPERRDDAAASSQRREDVLREASRALNEVRAALAADEKDESELVATLEYIAARRDGVSSGTAFDQLADVREVARKALAKHAKE